MGEGGSAHSGARDSRTPLRALSHTGVLIYMITAHEVYTCICARTYTYRCVLYARRRRISRHELKKYESPGREGKEAGFVVLLV